MDTLKKDALDAIRKLPDSATIDQIMYRLYVIDKVHKGRNAVDSGDVSSTEDLKKEMRTW